MYLDLCESLFDKYNDKLNPDMNFKKLLLKSGDTSQETIISGDAEEIAYERKVREFGKIRLIAGLFVRGQISDEIIESTFSANSEVNDDNIHKMYVLVTKIGKHIFSNPEWKKLTYAWFTDKVNELKALIDDERLSPWIKSMLANLESKLNEWSNHEEAKEVQSTKEDKP